VTRVGWVGAGAMGTPMAACVARSGIDVIAYDIDPERLKVLAGSGVQTSAGITEAAFGADVLVVTVATPAQAEAVLFGPAGAAEVLPPGSVVLMMATVGPAPVEEWSSRLAPRAIDIVDAPVSGGPARAERGDLLIMVSGGHAARARAEPVLKPMASQIAVVGQRPGDGQRVKLVNQLLCGVHIAAAAEALAYAESLGLDARMCWDVVRHGAAASFMLEDRGLRMVDDSDDAVHSALDIFVKDMGLVVGAAREQAHQVPLATTVRDLYLRGQRAGLGRHDDSALIELLRGSPAGEPDGLG